MGCNGCELWNPAAGVRICYAGQLTERYAGKKGWPQSFGESALFPGRLAEVLRWRDLTGQPRREKPWLDGLPRVVFLNDMGDSFASASEDGTWRLLPLPQGRRPRPWGRTGRRSEGRLSSRLGEELENTRGRWSKRRCRGTSRRGRLARLLRGQTRMAAPVGCSASFGMICCPVRPRPAQGHADDKGDGYDPKGEPRGPVLRDRGQPKLKCCMTAFRRPSQVSPVTS
jgi:hypothetical protein